jgi:hypothetical protein
VISAHEILYDSIKNKEKGLVLKLDYEKAYDRVNWQFLQEILISRGFRNKWVNWIMKLVKWVLFASVLMMKIAPI